MPINCPQCGAAMAELDATQAQCAKHGAYTILFKRSAVDDGLIPLAQTAPPTALPPPGAAPLGYARQYTPYAQAVPVAQIALGPCQNHPQVAAVQRCMQCAARICAVCDFSFPGEIHLCPRCVTSATGLSPGRRGMMYGAYGAAATATLMFAAFIFAAASGAMNEVAAIGMFVVLVACITTGLGLGFGTIDRKLNNPVSLWIAAIWNGVLALGFVLMMIVGLLAKNR